jgi:delta8-fatty-acid desaturase
VPFFAISTKFFNNVFSTYYRRFITYDAPARFFVSCQCVPEYLVQKQRDMPL